METVARTSTRRHGRLRITSARPTDFIDLTERIEALVAEAGILTGLVNIQTLHTTTAIVVNEHEPLLLADFDTLLERAAPSRAAYRHDDLGRRALVAPGERRNGRAHCRALLLNTSVCLNVVGGHLQLGRWQRILFVELDGPQTREISVLRIAGGEG